MAWEMRKLGDVLTFQRGFDITRSQQRDGPYAVISSSGPNSTHDRFMVEGPGVLIGRKGSLGTVFYSERPYWPHDTTLWVKDFHGNDPKFSYFFLQTMGFHKYDVGASNPTLNRNHIHLLQVKWPRSLELQRRIASILSAYDDLIENNTRRIEILEEMARRTYEEWFVRFRFPGHEKVRMVESELGLVPESWHVVEMGEIAKINERSVKRVNESDEIMYVDIASVSTASIVRRERMLFRDAPGRARRIVQDGDIIWSCVRPNRRSYAMILDPEPNLVVSTGFAVLSATIVPWTYLYQVATTDKFVSYLVNHAKGAAYPAVGTEDFQKAKILRPDDTVLDSFNRIAEPMARLSAAFMRKNAILLAIRDLLLPRLISGELDVSELPDPESAAA